MKDRIFIAISNKKTAVSVARMLLSDGIRVESAIKNIAELNKIFNYYRGGIIITNYIFDGININKIIDDVPEDFTIVLIGSKEHLDNCYDDKVFKLAIPLHKNDLVCAIEMLTVINSQYKPRETKTIEEQRTIEKAKHYLIDSYSMTEEHAHRYLQKKSMDTGKKVVDIAKIILEM